MAGEPPVREDFARQVLSQSLKRGDDPVEICAEGSRGLTLQDRKVEEAIEGTEQLSRMASNQRGTRGGSGIEP